MLLTIDKTNSIFFKISQWYLKERTKKEFQTQLMVKLNHNYFCLKKALSTM